MRHGVGPTPGSGRPCTTRSVPPAPSSTSAPGRAVRAERPLRRRRRAVGDDARSAPGSRAGRRVLRRDAPLPRCGVRRCDGDGHRAPVERHRGGPRRDASVSRDRVVVLTFDPDAFDTFWLDEYAPEITAVERRRMPAIAEVQSLLGPTASVVDVPIPADCTDGFGEAFFGRPERMLDPAVRPRAVGVGLRRRRRRGAVRGAVGCGPRLGRVGRPARSPAPTSHLCGLAPDHRRVSEPWEARRR